MCHPPLNDRPFNFSGPPPLPTNDQTPQSRRRSLSHPPVVCVEKFIDARAFLFFLFTARFCYRWTRHRFAVLSSKAVSIVSQRIKNSTGLGFTKTNKQTKQTPSFISPSFLVQLSHNDDTISSNELAMFLWPSRQRNVVDEPKNKTKRNETKQESEQAGRALCLWIEIFPACTSCPVFAFCPTLPVSLFSIYYWYKRRNGPRAKATSASAPVPSAPLEQRKRRRHTPKRQLPERNPTPATATIRLEHPHRTQSAPPLIDTKSSRRAKYIDLKKKRNARVQWLTPTLVEKLISEMNNSKTDASRDFQEPPPPSPAHHHHHHRPVVVYF